MCKINSKNWINLFFDFLSVTFFLQTFFFYESLCWKNDQLWRNCVEVARTSKIFRNVFRVSVSSWEKNPRQIDLCFCFIFFDATAFDNIIFFAGEERATFWGDFFGATFSWPTSTFRPRKCRPWKPNKMSSSQGGRRTKCRPRQGCQQKKIFWKYKKYLSFKGFKISPPYK